MCSITGNRSSQAFLHFLAAVMVVGGAEWFARRKERGEVAAIRASVAIEKSSSSIFNYPSVVLAGVSSSAGSVDGSAAMAARPSGTTI